MCCIIPHYFSFNSQVQLLHPHPGWVELDPHVLWDQFVDIITEVMEGKYCNNLSVLLNCQQGSKLRPVQFYLRLNFFPLRLKYLEKSQICDLFSILILI